MRDQQRIWPLALLAAIGTLFAIALVVAITPSGKAQDESAQHFRGNFGVSLDDVPTQDRPFLDMVMATEVAAATQYPTAIPFATHEAYPTPPPRPTGITANMMFSLPGEFYYMGNGWQGKVDDYYLQVLCVTLNQEPEQGWLLVAAISDSTIRPKQMPDGPAWYKTPLRVGRVHITEVNGLALTLVADNDSKATFIFDAGKRTWIVQPGSIEIAARPGTLPTLMPDASVWSRPDTGTTTPEQTKP